MLTRSSVVSLRNLYRGIFLSIVPKEISSNSFFRAIVFIVASDKILESAVIYKLLAELKNSVAFA